jgi:hypothetical protein
MYVSAAAPVAWDHRILAPVLSRGFADAMTTLGWSPVYAWDGSDAALVLIRRLPVPGLRGWTSRAHIYVNHGYPTFVRELHGWLDDERVGYATIGDAVWPSPGHLRGALPRMRVTDVQRIVHDVQRDDATLLAGMDAKARAQVRRAEGTGVVVSEILSEDDLESFLALGAHTAARIRERNLAFALPDAFFRVILRSLVPEGRATFLMAHAEDRPLAGALFVNSARAMTYYHGVSTRDPALTPRQGPSALVWRAMRLARERKIPYFDHGAVTVTDDPAHPHHSVYAFKRRFGGRTEAVATAELVLSRVKHAFHQRVLMPAWKRLRPLYVRVASTTALSAGWMVAWAT